MNEASVSGPLMSELRKRLTPSKVIKHHDASMIGLPDCSVTYSKQVWWLEFKFVEFKRKWENYADWEIVAAIMAATVKDSPTQAQMLRDLQECAAGAYYIIWVKKTCVYVINPSDWSRFAYCRSTQEAVQTVENLIHGNLSLL